MLSTMRSVSSLTPAFDPAASAARAPRSAVSRGGADRDRIAVASKSKRDDTRSARSPMPGTASRPSRSRPACSDSAASALRRVAATMLTAVRGGIAWVAGGSTSIRSTIASELDRARRAAARSSSSSLRADRDAGAYAASSPPRYRPCASSTAAMAGRTSVVVQVGHAT